METMLQQQVAAESIALIDRTGLPITDKERAELSVCDFGLGNVRVEGVQYIDLVLTPIVRISLLVLLPDQSLPQHRHPAHDQSAGKEETARAVMGEPRVYTPGPDRLNAGFIVQGKEEHYTARNETVLNPGRTLTVAPELEHWFQAGPAGAVLFTFQNRVDESLNIFTDPGITTVCGVELARTASHGKGAH
jgi:D-lyxose ketol-isomerase